MTRVDEATDSTPERRAAAMEFLKSYLEMVARLAADPRVFPTDGEVYLTTPAAPTEDEVHQRILQEALGDDWGTAGESKNRITLNPESEKAAELPSKDYRAKATLQILSASQFEVACGASREACNWQKLGDGNVVHWRAWADRDSSEDTMRGELATYYPRADGSVVMAMVTVLGRDVAAAERDTHRDATFTWLESLRHQLIAASLDKRIAAGIAADQ